MDGFFYQDKLNGRRHVWTQQEEDIVNQLILQFEFDYETISNIMNETFQTNEFSINCIKAWKKNPQTNKAPFTKEEAKILVEQMRLNVLKSGCYIWITLEPYFENRPAYIISKNFRFIISFVIKRLNMFFGQPDKQIICSESIIHFLIDNRRINKLRDITLQLIFFFGQQSASSFLYNQYLYLIVLACNKLIPYIKQFVDIGFTYQTDVKYYFDHRPFEKLRRMVSEEFNDLIEPILLLEQKLRKIYSTSTLNRIAFGQWPYDYGFIKAQYTTKQKNKVDLNKEQRRKVQEKKTASKRQKIVNPYISDFKILTKEEVKAIRDSETAEAILPFQVNFYYRKKN